ncbi:capsule assembly Wzi family protein [Pleomorphovibrio marinus]|uniref:capsule assembly Wzi family protein n=1 Tax=Pleomorphovibrio marinus TaxID=2164132 RepID=UPI001E2BD768|nr:capsule assembly Wzi family protein [Pleomorphovibrio marinus]
MSLQPEFNFSENRSFSGYPDYFERGVNVARFRYWNTGDFPEIFHDQPHLAFWYGQSKVSLTHKSFELGVSTQNIWWGPGQFNSLVFSNNAKGFPHLSLNTVKPVSTFLGNFEGQVLVGRLENSLRQPTQSDQLNNDYFRNFNGDWRYLNGFTITYNPKWISGMFLGLSRAYHQYNNDMSGHIREYFPIFDPFQKDSFGFERDGEGRDQIASVFMRYVVPNAQSEFYFEFGRRDHSLNWREFLLNPEHARAYLLGFTHLVDLTGMRPKLQFRGEITHQQESVNRYIRYPGLGGNITWHTHWNARGFVNHGQALGVGSGVGSNVQTLEVAFVDKFNKLGILMERLANHQDFYFRAFGQQREHKPWVDLSLGLLFSHQWERFLVDSRLQFIHANNYQWQLKPESEPNFPVGVHKFSVFGQMKLIYLMNLDQLRK